MNAKHLSPYLVLLLGITIFGCKSNSVAPSSDGLPVVKISPAHFRGVQFVVDTFQARISNHDFAQTYFRWDMGDSTFYSHLSSFESVYAYSKPGIYTIRVQAFDIYSNNVIASDSIIAVIDTEKTTVEIIPQFYNGTLTTNTLGGFDPFSLSVKSSIPETELYQFWDYGDGTTDSFKSGATTHIFPHPGTYVLKVDVYQKGGIYVGSDTARVTVDLPPITLDMLKHATRFEEFFYVDSSYAQFIRAQGSLPFQMSLHFRQDSLHVSSWNGNDFSIAFHEIANGNVTQDESIGGTVSADLKSISTLSAQANVVFSSNNSGGYGFKVTNLKLVGITKDNRIIYRVSGSDARNNLQVASLNVGSLFSISNLANIGSQGASLDDWRLFIHNPPPPDPVIILVFDQN